MRTVLVVVLGVAVLLGQMAVAAAQAPPGPSSPPKLEPVVVESSLFPPDRTATEQEAREEIQRVPGGVEIVGMCLASEMPCSISFNSLVHRSQSRKCVATFDA